MRHLVGICALVLLGLFAEAANADAYTFYQIRNGAHLVNETHARSPFQACRDTVSAPYDAALTQQVVGQRFSPGTSTCLLYLDDKSQASIVATSVAGSCADAIEFNFDEQQCVDGVNADQNHALALATFLWISLIGGLCVGYQVGQ